MKKIILASSSPRRRELLDQVGIPYTVDASEADETMPAGTAPREYVEILSARKAEDVAARHPHDIVLGADTIVALDDRILGKPSDHDEAYEMLCALSGKIHSVHTGVTIIFPAGDTAGKKETFSVRTDVRMFPNDSGLIRDYADSDEPMDKAGAYGIQGRGAVLVERIEGDYFNVMGLPVSEVYHRLYSYFR